MMELLIDFPGGVRVDAHWGEFVVRTDQPTGEGGEGSAPTPFDYFLASLGTCAGFYVQSFCRSRGLATDQLRLTQRHVTDPTTHMITQVTIDIELPPDFPAKYRAAVIRAAEQCKVKKHVEQPPRFVIQTVTAE